MKHVTSKCEHVTSKCRLKLVEFERNFFEFSKNSGKKCQEGQQDADIHYFPSFSMYNEQWQSNIDSLIYITWAHWPLALNQWYGCTSKSIDLTDHKKLFVFFQIARLLWVLSRFGHFQKTTLRYQYAIPSHSGTWS